MRRLSWALSDQYVNVRVLRQLGSLGMYPDYSFALRGVVCRKLLSEVHIRYRNRKSACLCMLGTHGVRLPIVEPVFDARSALLDFVTN